jgi:hypothetical protein
LELTDHAACAESHPAAPCQRDTPPYGPWAAIGLYAADSRNIDLAHLNIHGLASRGVWAGRLTDWRVTDVRIALNGGAGWDGDLADETLGTSNHGTISFNRLVVEWNGCVESLAGQPTNCWAQNAGGYGDGLGTGNTVGNWLFQDSTFRYNTSDGLDLLYARPISGSVELPFVSIEKSVFMGNAGNQVKTNGSMHMENSLVVGNCGFFLDKPYAQAMGARDSGDHCRATGNALSLTLGPRNAVTVTNSTLVGQGDCLAIIACDEYQRCDGSEKVILANSVFSGATDFTDPNDRTCMAWVDSESSQPFTGSVAAEYNLYNDLKYDASFSLGSYALVDLDPLFANSAFESFDGHLRTGSPAVDSGLPVGLAPLGEAIPNHDLEGTSRPQGAGVDRGAYER